VCFFIVATRRNFTLGPVNDDASVEKAHLRRLVGRVAVVNHRLDGIVVGGGKVVLTDSAGRYDALPRARPVPGDLSVGNFIRLTIVAYGPVRGFLGVFGPVGEAGRYAACMHGISLKGRHGLPPAIIVPSAQV